MHNIFLHIKTLTQLCCFSTLLEIFFFCYLFLNGNHLFYVIVIISPHNYNCVTSLALLKKFHNYDFLSLQIGVYTLLVAWDSKSHLWALPAATSRILIVFFTMSSVPQSPLFCHPRFSCQFRARRMLGWLVPCLFKFLLGRSRYFWRKKGW